MQNFSYENEFDLHENGRLGKRHFRTKTRFDTEANQTAQKLADFVCTLQGILKRTSDDDLLFTSVYFSGC